MELVANCPVNHFFWLVLKSELDTYLLEECRQCCRFSTEQFSDKTKNLEMKTKASFLLCIQTPEHWIFCVLKSVLFQ